MAKPLILIPNQETGCIEHTQKGEYGSSHGKRLHRMVFEDKYGYLPEVVMHVCDNPRCLNVNHLKAGTWDENNKDRATKGRSAKRNDNHRKLNDEQAQEIRDRWAIRNPLCDRVNGVTALSREFGVDTGVIYNIIKGKSHFA